MLEEKENKEQMGNMETNSKMVDLNHINIHNHITVNGLNTSVIKHRLSNCIEKEDTNICFL